MTDPISVFFPCTHDSARSQRAAGLLRELGADGYQVMSAGTQRNQVRSEATEAIVELGIDIRDDGSKALDPFVERPHNPAITVRDDANESCPVLPNAKRSRHWSIDDPRAATKFEQERMNA